MSLSSDMSERNRMTDRLPITPPSGTGTTRETLTKLTIPAKLAREGTESRPSSSSGSSLFLSSSPNSAGQFLSPPQTPVLVSAKTPPSRNDIFSEEASATSLPTLTTPVVTHSGHKERLKGLGLPGHFEEFDVWDTEARRRRSGAYVRGSSRTSRSSTPSITEESGLRVDFNNFLGRGLTSTVYTATLRGETIAAKIPTNLESQQILEREAAVLTHIHSHRTSTEYIVPFYGKYNFDDSLALCLELCPQTMQEYIAQQSGSPAPVIGRELWKTWLSTLLSGLEFLHDSGILHNDIKPQNILLTNTLHPYISDFAVSTPLCHLELPPSPDLHILGTTVYTAPELLLSADDVPTTPASDIYSLGITMFVAATGLEPFSWTRSITQKIMMKKRGDIFAGTEVRMPHRMMEIIKGMCASDPSRRWDYTRIRRTLNDL